MPAGKPVSSAMDGNFPEPLTPTQSNGCPQAFTSLCLDSGFPAGMTDLGVPQIFVHKDKRGAWE
jgi:hypothetical protein